MSSPPTAPSGPRRSTRPNGFDGASRCEIVAFTLALAPLDAATPDYAALTGIADPHVASVTSWHERTMRVLAANFRAASASCSPGELLCRSDGAAPVDVRSAASGFTQAIPERYRRWYDDARRFYARHVREQLHLAGSFPWVSSEILPLDERERTGFELPDKSFRLTFDDGPTSKGGHSDALVALLADLKLTAHFFLRGDRIERRQRESGDVRALFAGQCVASHGFRHESHAVMEDWRESIVRTAALLEAVVGEPGPFHWRPPYGARTKDAAPFVAGLRGANVVLWNIDSLDWQKAITPAAVRGRVIPLMLAWRRGIVLVHDVHEAVQRSLPAIVRDLEGSGVEWLDCARHPI